jgi:hypothetical protein
MIAYYASLRLNYRNPSIKIFPLILSWKYFKIQKISQQGNSFCICPVKEHVKHLIHQSWLL